MLCFDHQRGAGCSGLMNPDTNLGGNIATTEEVLKLEVPFFVSSVDEHIELPCNVIALRTAHPCAQSRSTVHPEHNGPDLRYLPHLWTNEHHLLLKV